jgi:uncharacterized protein
MARTCEQCGTEAVPGATTCRRCGATLPPGGDAAAGGDRTWGEVGQGEVDPGAVDPGAAGGATSSWGTASRPPAPRTSTSDHNLGLLAHLSAYAAFVGLPPFVGPLVVWLWQRDRDPFVEAHAREALNFNLSVLIYAVVGGVVAAFVAVLTFGIGMFVVIPAVVVFAVAWFVLVLVAGLAAGRGERYRYPLTIRFVR